MAKNRNKGFSLIEVIIGIAVLTILLTPIVKQLAQTMQTNRLTKEQQYATESAVNLLEYAQKTSFNELKQVASSGDTYLTATPDTKSYDCDIMIYNPTTGDITSIDDYAATAGVKATYNSIIYKMNDVKLGSRNTEYTRTLILDDLSNKLSAIKVEEKTDPTKLLSLRVYYSSERDEELPDGYQFSSEGSIVKYEGEGNEKHVSGVVCKLDDGSKAVNDPNETLLGSMHDLSSTQVALVNGDATNFDVQAEQDLYAAALAYLKENNLAKYQQAINGQNNPLSEAGYLDGLKKSTIIKISEGKDAGEPYFNVKVDVVYTNTANVKLDYNAFSQKFYYKDKDEDDNPLTAPACPAVYIEYQPFSVEGAKYSSDDYIYVENYVDNAKIYLYQPAKDMMYADANSTFDKTSIVDATGEYVVDAAGGVKTKIHINNVIGTDNSKSTVAPDIFTNLVDETYNPDGSKSYSVNADQFKLDKVTTGSIYDATKIDEYPADKLQALDKDTTTVERLYTATVMVEPKTASVNSVILTGAKGE